MVKKLLSVGFTLYFFTLLVLGILLLGSRFELFGYQLRVVLSGSMSPTIPVGAVILTKAKDNYQKGDIITFKRSTEISATTHRIVDIKNMAGETEFIVQGDANGAVDLRPVGRGEIKGAIKFTIPYLGYLVDFARRPIGFFVMILVPLGLILFEKINQKRLLGITKTSNSV